MSTFSDNSYSSKLYSDFRPSYNEKLLAKLNNYCKGDRKLAVDVGCGPGTLTFDLVKYFNTAIGFDPSEVMIEQANRILKEKRAEIPDNRHIEFHIAAAEDLTAVIKDRSVDLVTASQSAHWFDHKRWFKECYRILRPGGTLAIVGYADVRYDNEAANELVEEYSYGDKYLGPYWEPGRQTVRNLFKDVKIPREYFTEEKREIFIPGMGSALKPGSVHDEANMLVSKTMSLEAHKSYFRTWSSYYSWKKEQGAEENPSSFDMVDDFFSRLKKVTGWTDKDIIKVRWSSILILARRLA
ncbi:S-adenosyl-L-methionine-dependent methyltransferase [Dipodascopsis uninucleata]